MGVSVVEVQCAFCEVKFLAREVDIKRGDGKFCSIECRNDAQRDVGRQKFLSYCEEQPYDYSKANYVNSKTKVEIICPIHGSFWQKPERHVKGGGCQKCGWQRTSAKLRGPRRTQNDFITKAFEVHGSLYDYSRAMYVGCFDQVEVICRKHGSFFPSATSHLNGQGCPKCGNEKVGDALRSSLEEFIQRAFEAHGDRYSYKLVQYHTAVLPVKIICPKHGVFEQKPYVHLAGSGCSRCSVRVSKPETKWLDSLDIDGLRRQYSLSVSGRRHIVDGYDPVSNTVYQFHGDYYHGNPQVFPRCGWNKVCKKFFGELYDKTCGLDQAVIEAGYNLVVIWEADWTRSQHVA